MFTFSLKPLIWLFQVVVLQRTAKKCTNILKTHVLRDCCFALLSLLSSLLISSQVLDTTAEWRIAKGRFVAFVPFRYIHFQNLITVVIVAGNTKVEGEIMS